jgi:hypothetical protein
MFAQTDERVVAFRIDHSRERFGAYCRIRFPGVRDTALPMFDCVLDTGSMRIVVPQRFWSACVPNPATLTPRRINGVGGPLGVYEAVYEVVIIGVMDPTVTRWPPYSLGRCSVWLARDHDAVNAAVAEGLDLATARDRYQLRHGLLGMGGGAFDRGGVCINWQERCAHFVEIP